MKHAQITNGTKPATQAKQPIRRNLAFYKKAYSPWTIDEFNTVVRSTEGNNACIVTEHSGVNLCRKFIYDNGDSTDFMSTWANQDTGHCDVYAYEDVFGTEDRIAIVIKSFNGFPAGAHVKQVNRDEKLPIELGASWKLIDDYRSSPMTYRCYIGAGLMWEDAVPKTSSIKPNYQEQNTIITCLKERAMPSTFSSTGIQKLLIQLFAGEKPATDYDKRPAHLVVAYSRDGSELGTATADDISIVENRVANTPELWGL